MCVWKLELRPQAQGYGASPYPRCWAATTTHSSMLFQAFCQKMKIMGPTATYLAQFCAIQFPPQTLASCYCQGLKFCMDGRNTMLHGLKLHSGLRSLNRLLEIATALYHWHEMHVRHCRDEREHLQACLHNPLFRHGMYSG